jgi:hypothetical protein
MEEWVIPEVKRMPNSTLRLVMQRPHSKRFEAVPGKDIMLPVWHTFGDDKGYFVDHLMYDLQPNVDERPFFSYPLPPTCRSADAGLVMTPSMHSSADIAARALCKEYAEGGGCKEEMTELRRSNASTLSRCPFARMLTSGGSNPHEKVEMHIVDPELFEDHIRFMGRDAVY